MYPSRFLILWSIYCLRILFRAFEDIKRVSCGADEFFYTVLLMWSVGCVAVSTVLCGKTLPPITKPLNAHTPVKSSPFYSCRGS